MIHDIIYAILAMKTYDMTLSKPWRRPKARWSGVYNANYDNAEHDYICRVTWRVGRRPGGVAKVIPIPRSCEMPTKSIECSSSIWILLMVQKSGDHHLGYIKPW